MAVSTAGDAVAVSATNWHLLSPSTRVKSCAAVAAWPSHPPKEFRVQSRDEALCAPGKLAGQVFS